jgi:ribonuclease HI
MLSMPILNGRIGKWILALSEFELKFESAKAVKGQIIADFITEHRDPSIDLLEITPWALFFDGSSCGKGGGVGILLISPRGEVFEFAIPIQPTVTNNQAKYEALLRGLQYLKEAGAVSVEVYGDSELVIKQLNGQYECKSDALRNYYKECREILKSFQLVILQHIPREHNEEETSWLKVLQVIGKVKKHLPWRCLLSEGISRKMIGERKSLIIWRIHPEKFLGSSGTKLLNLFFWMEVYSINHWMGCCCDAWVQKKQRR